MIIGRSTHNVEQVKEASEKEFDYVLFGPVFPTPSKPNRTEENLPGLEGLEQATESADIPVLALGGVGPEKITDCLSAGANGAAGIRALFAPEEPKYNWKKIKTALSNYE